MESEKPQDTEEVELRLPNIQLKVLKGLAERADTKPEDLLLKWLEERLNSEVQP